MVVPVVHQIETGLGRGHDSEQVNDRQIGVAVKGVIVILCRSRDWCENHSIPQHSRHYGLLTHPKEIYRILVGAQSSREPDQKSLSVHGRFHDPRHHVQVAAKGPEITV